MFLAHASDRPSRELRPAARARARARRIDAFAACYRTRV